MQRRRKLVGDEGCREPFGIWTTLALTVCMMLCFGTTLLVAGNESHSAVTSTNTLVAASSAVAATAKDIDLTIDELNALRTRISGERTGLASRLMTLKEQVREKRLEVRRLRRIEAQGQEERDALERDVSGLGDDAAFIRTVLTEWRRSFRVVMGTGEPELYRKDLELIDGFLGDAGSSTALVAVAQCLVRTTEDWNRKKTSGMIFDGACLDNEGVERNGKFAGIGPTAYFVSGNGTTAGLAVMRLGSVLPSVFENLEPDQIEAIRMLVSGAEATVPVDVTSGDALKIKESRKTMMQHVESGGIVVYPLLLIAAAALAIAVLKTIGLMRVRPGKPGDIDATIGLLNAGKIDEAVVAADRLGRPLSYIVRDGIAHRAASKEQVEEIMNEHVLEYLPALERHLGVLAALGGVAPLLGLLGTVTGMIHTFQLVMVFGSGDAKLLSGGISEALVTTEIGLAIAIPVILVHALLSRRVRRIVAMLERSIVHFVNRLEVETS